MHLLTMALRAAVLQSRSYKSNLSRRRRSNDTIRGDPKIRVLRLRQPSDSIFDRSNLRFLPKLCSMDYLIPKMNPSVESRDNVSLPLEIFLKLFMPDLIVGNAFPIPLGQQLPLLIQSVKSVRIVDVHKLQHHLVDRKSILLELGSVELHQ